MAVIPVLSRNTVTSLAHHGTVPHCHLDFFYSNTNNFVQLEDTTIKTELSCSMQHTERTNDIAIACIAAVVPTGFLAPRD